VLPDPHKDARGLVPDFQPTAAEQERGYALFTRDWMQEVAVNAVPRREEVTDRLDAFASAGEMEPVVFSVYPLRDRGAVTVSVSDLTGPEGTVPASAVRVGLVSHRLSRVTMEGTVYTIAPRFVMPRAAADLRQGVKVRPGTYTGQVRLAFADGTQDSLSLTARLFATPLDEVDIPVGPWGCSIDLPWYAEDLGGYNDEMFRQCLAKMREYGLTSFSGIPTLRLRGWQDGRPDFDFSRADAEMAAVKAAGFTQMVVNYGNGIPGFNNYLIDTAAMQAAGFTDYGEFLRAVLTAIDDHAREAGWLPVAYNLCDEPVDATIAPTAENARAWREAAPETLITTGATSLQNPQPDDPHLPLATALKIADLNNHDAAAIKLIHDAGGDWAFYNSGSRWTFGTYMYKCAQEYAMKYRLSWHWNACAGDPYYALDCREDDYAWCVANAAGDLIPTLHFERDIREGLDDYRYMLTLARLLAAKPDHPQAPAAHQLLADKLAAFELGERDPEAKWPVEEFRSYPLRLAEAIEALSG